VPGGRPGEAVGAVAVGESDEGGAVECHLGAIKEYPGVGVGDGSAEGGGAGLGEQSRRRESDGERDDDGEDTEKRTHGV